MVDIKFTYTYLYTYICEVNLKIPRWSHTNSLIDEILKMIYFIFCNAIKNWIKKKYMKQLFLRNDPIFRTSKTNKS